MERQLLKDFVGSQPFCVPCEKMDHVNNVTLELDKIHSRIVKIGEKIIQGELNAEHLTALEALWQEFLKKDEKLKELAETLSGVSKKVRKVWLRRMQQYKEDCFEPAQRSYRNVKKLYERKIEGEFKR